MTILLLGATGQVGWELRRTLAPLGAVLAPGRVELDLARPDALRAYLRGVSPALIVNAAAYTAVDAAEAEPAVADAVNAAAPALLAEEAGRRGIALVHYSTDYVFDGAKATPYTEADPAAPLNAYGRSKLAGEQAIRGSGAEHLILRTSWVYGTRGHNFLRTILRLAAERDALRVVDDQFGAPTWSRMIAEATALILVRCRTPDGAFRLGERSGLYHLAAAGATTWCGFARAILAGAPQRGRLTAADVQPIATADYPTPARRPANSRLDCTRLREAFGIALPDWQESLGQVLAELAGCAG